MKTKMLLALVALAAMTYFIVLLLPSLAEEDSNLLIRSFLIANIVGWGFAARYVWQNRMCFKR